MSSPKKKGGMLRRFFSKKSEDHDDSHSSKKDTAKLQRSQTVQPTRSSLIDEDIAHAAVGMKKRMPEKQRSVDEDDGAANRIEKKPKEKARKISTAAKKKLAKRKESTGVYIDPNTPLDYPCTPELILEYHKKKPFLTQNEEWLLVELNEFECLVDSEDIIKVIAKHSKFFEVDPDELWSEFFEYVEEIPAYDEVINYDIWQEFRDEKYPC